MKGGRQSAGGESERQRQREGGREPEGAEGEKEGERGRKQYYLIRLLLC